MSTALVMILSLLLFGVAIASVFDSSSAIIEKRTGYVIPPSMEGLPLTRYGATFEPTNMVPGADREERLVPAGTPLSAVAFYDAQQVSIIWSRIHFRPLNCGDHWYNFYVCGIPKEVDVKHNRGVMLEKNQKVPGYFTEDDMKLAEKCMKRLDYLRDQDEFMFRFDGNVSPTEIEFIYKKASTGQWEVQDRFPFGKQNYDRFRQVLLDRSDWDNRQLPTPTGKK